MNKFVMDGLTIGALAVVGVGGFIGYKVYSINEKVDVLIQDIDNLNKEIPVEFRPTHIVKKGMFESKGEYKFKYENAGKFLEITLDYSIDHGFGSIFSRKYPLYGKIIMQDNAGITEILGLKGKNVFNISGDYQTSGVLNVIAESASFDLEKVMGIKTSPLLLKYFINFNDKSARLDMEMKEIKGNGGKIELLGFKSTFESSMVNPLEASGSTTVEEISSPYAFMKNLSVRYLSEKINEKYKISTSMEVKNAKSIMQKHSFQTGLNISLNDLNAKVIEDIYKKYQEFNANQKKDLSISKDLASLFKDGFSIDLKNLYYQDKLNKLHGNGLLTINKQDIDKPVDLKRTTQLRLNMTGEGELIKFVKMMLDEQYFENQNSNQAKAEILYNKGHIQLNGKQPSQQERALIYNKLDELSKDINENLK